jgi:phosphate transport system substrate-binding protein
MKRMSNRVAAPAALSLLTLLSLEVAPAAAQAIKVDAAIPKYAKTSGVSGNVNSIGSDTLNNLMTFWAEGFQKQYPNVRIQIEGKGSSTAPPALIAGTAQLGPMSREMKAEEIDQFEKKYGYKPTLVKVALDGLAVYVNKDNPLEELTMAQVDAIFSKTRKCGGKDISTWAGAGLGADWGAKPISLYGRNSASGTYGFFKEHALCKGDFRDTVKEQPGSASVVQGVTEDLYGIGYSGVGYRTSGVKPLKIAAKPGQPAYSTSADDVYAGRYPISRFLFVYVNKAPNKPMDPLVREFVKFMLSAEGQESVAKDGYFPLTAALAQGELAKIQ